MGRKQYRIQLLIMFLLLGVMIFMLTQLFFDAPELGSSNEISGLNMLLVLPARFFGEKIPESIVNFIPDEHWTLSAFANSIANGEVTFTLIFTYALSGILAITAIVILLSAITAFLRLILNKPYGHGRLRYLMLLFLNLVGIGLCYAVANIDALKQLFVSGETFFIFYTPDLFYFIFTGGLFALYIMSRLASKKEIL